MTPIDRRRSDIDRDSYLARLPSSNATEVLVFIHGICGDAKTTWRAFGPLMSEGVFAKIDYGSFGYASPWIALRNPQYVSRKFILWAKTHLREYDKVFVVAHSMGCLLIRHACVNMIESGSSEEARLLSRIKHCFLVAPPLSGSFAAKVLNWTPLRWVNRRIPYLANPRIDSEKMAKRYRRVIERAGEKVVYRPTYSIYVGEKDWLVGEPNSKDLTEDDTFEGFLAGSHKSIKGSLTAESTLVRRIQQVVSRYIGQGPTAEHSGDLPARGTTKLVGREGECKRLSDDWLDENVTIVHVYAGAGAGKSALVSRWLHGFRGSEDTGSDKSLVWSFYNQDKHSYRSNADGWFEKARDHFPIAESDWQSASPKERGYMVAERHVRHGGLIVLDGMETLLEHRKPDQGKLCAEHLALEAMFERLLALGVKNCEHARRLVVVTTRIPVKVLCPAYEFVDDMPLAPLSEPDAEKLLREFRLPSFPDRKLHPEGELKAVAEELRGHPLSLCLLASHVMVAHQGDLARRMSFPNVLAKVRPRKDSQQDDVRHAARVIEDFAGYLTTGSDLQQAGHQLLRILAVVGKPLAKETIQACLEGDPIPGVTNKLAHANIEAVTNELLGLRIVTETSEYGESRPAAHPIIQETLRSQLEREDFEGWKTINMRLCGHYRDFILAIPREGKEPRSRAEYETLYRAVDHGCKARDEDSMFTEVYRRHITDEDVGTATRYYPFFHMQLSALRSFFADGDEKEPQQPLLSCERDQIILLRDFGFCCWKLGQVGVGEKYFRMAIRRSLALPNDDAYEVDRKERSKSWNMAITSRNLTNLLIDQGKFRKAIAVWDSNIGYADSTEDEFMRFGVRCSIGIAQTFLGELEKAEGAFDDAWSEAAKTSFSKLRFLPLCHFCEYLAIRGRFQEAFDLLSAELDSELSEANAGLTHLTLANVQSRAAKGDKGFAERALDTLEMAEVELRAAGRWDCLPDTYVVRAIAYLRRGETDDLERAKKSNEVALALAESGNVERSRLWASVVETLLLCRGVGMSAVDIEAEDLRRKVAECRRIVGKKGRGYHSLEDLVAEMRQLVERARKP